PGGGPARGAALLVDQDRERGAPRRGRRGRGVELPRVGRPPVEDRVEAAAAVARVAPAALLGGEPPDVERGEPGVGGHAGRVVLGQGGLVPGAGEGPQLTGGTARAGDGAPGGDQGVGV